MQDYQSVIYHMQKFNLPFDVKKYFSKKDINKIVYFMTKDKKNFSNKINLILLKKIGFTIINNQYDILNIKKFIKNEIAY